ncbi:MAG: UpxY family transcription antiterminator [Prolixibacteraceae bacterium]|nr:UpxY family transcription antiterminator [Prolixibacteraceae bacterium]
MKNWYALYIRPRAEKKVRILLDIKGIENYLPVKKTLRQWSDRKKWVEIPAISGYIFIRINQEERLTALQTDLVTGFVKTKGGDAIIPDEQISIMKQILGQEEFNTETDTVKYTKGEAVSVVAGQLSGLKGNLISVKNKQKFLVQIDQININIIVEIPSVFLKKESTKSKK